MFARVSVAKFSMPQFLQAGLDALWLRVLSNRHPRGLHIFALNPICPRLAINSHYTLYSSACYFRRRLFISDENSSGQ
jgi:hypothetical protein